MADEDKTEDPTPKKLDDARQQGDVPQSRDFASFIIFLGLGLGMYFSSDRMLVGLKKVLLSYLSLERGLPETTEEMLTFINTSMMDVVYLIAPILAAVFVFGVAGYISQFGLLFTSEKLTPDFGKINPAKGLTRIFSKDTLIEFVKSSLKVIIFTVILYFMLEGEIDHIVEIGASPVMMILMYLGEMIARLILASLLFIGVLGILDLAYQKWSFWNRMKMSLKEVRDEYKQREGDPHVKGRIRQIQREMSRARMMDKVPAADVVVANPTHVAVALQYVKGQSTAPIVVAKGAGYIAVKIKTLAIESGVPVLEKRELARFLYKNIEIGQTIPESLYSAVAEVLAFVYRLKKKYQSLGGVPKRLLTNADGV